MNTTAKRVTCIIAIVLAFCLMVAGIYVLVRSSVMNKNPNPIEVAAKDNGANNDGSGDKINDEDKNPATPSDIEDQNGNDQSGDTTTLKANKLTIKDNKTSFEKTYTGSALPIVLGTDFFVEQDNGVYVYYSVKNAASSKSADAQYTKTAPSEVGKYYVKILIHSGNGYTNFAKIYVYNIVEKQAQTDPTTPIVKKTNKITILNGKTYFEKEYTGSAVKLVKGVDFKTESDSDIVTVSYKSAGDSSYTTTAPSAVGEYIARIAVKSSDEYNSLSKTFTFKIIEATNPVVTPEPVAATKTNSVTIKNGATKFVKTYTGKQLKIEVGKDFTVAGNAENVEVKYSDSPSAPYTYRTIAPIKPGTYKVKITILEGEGYKKYIKEFDYVINKKVITKTTYTIYSSNSKTISYKLTTDDGVFTYDEVILYITLKDLNKGDNKVPASVEVLGKSKDNYSIDTSNIRVNFLNLIAHIAIEGKTFKVGDAIPTNATSGLTITNLPSNFTDVYCFGGYAKKVFNEQTQEWEYTSNTSNTTASIAKFTEKPGTYAVIVDIYAHIDGAQYGTLIIENEIFEFTVAY